MSVFRIIIAADLPSSENTNWRDKLIQKFLEGINSSGWEEISTLKTKEEIIYFDDICDYMGITCRDTEVTEVLFRDFIHGNFQIGYLPHSVEVVDISYSRQTFQLETRAFPRQLRSIQLFINLITGSIDLTNLPTNLEEAHFDGNQLTGPISLTCLPRTLRILHLGMNPIAQHTVLVGALPPHIETIALPTRNKRLGVGRVQCIHPNDLATAKRVLKGIKVVG